jgi:hypothetical protein
MDRIVVLLKIMLESCGKMIIRNISEVIKKILKLIAFQLFSSAKSSKILK